jgi:ATP-dependent DNA ligase
MHPKTEISPSRASVEKILTAGWVGQLKIHGHRAQIHLPADPKEEPIAYNRQGRPHAKLLPDEIVRELRRVFDLTEDWTIVDTEWLKPENKLFVFDCLKLNGKLLRTSTYLERWKLLPRMYISPHIQTLPLLTTVEKCMEVLAGEDPLLEGLVFKSAQSKGFEDTSIVRCRKKVR